MTDKEKIADAANNVENKYIKNIPENFWFLRFLDQYMQGHKGFIAGGCFKNILSREKVKDVDIFFHNQSDFDEANGFVHSIYEEEIKIELKSVTHKKQKLNNPLRY